MKYIIRLLPIYIIIFSAFSFVNAQEKIEISKLQNPVTVQYLKSHLRKSQPRLVLNSTIEKNLKKRLKTDPIVQNVYKAIQLNAAEIQKKPLLSRDMVGLRLLGTSNEMLYRMNMLGMVYRIEKDPVILNRINKELLAVCNFTDWNPSHYLDVAEMSMAVAIAIDWTAGKLPKSTIELAQKSLIEKGINPSYNKKENIWAKIGDDKKENDWWINGSNNWNQVCNGGMIAASIAIAEVDPELAAKTISRSLEGMPNALKEYCPDGVYPEGSTYWDYGTSFSAVTSAILESAFGTDFGIADYPGFIKSASFRVLCNAPSGWYFNYSDCGDKRNENGDFTLAWFAAKTGDKTFFEKERFLLPADKMGKLTRLGGAGLVWLSQYKEEGEQKLPTAWKGDGANPIVLFNGGDNDPHQYYFGGKGGCGRVNHGNMDGGSFVFELNGIRWSIDQGSQGYNKLEEAGFNLWSHAQNSDRWTLLAKNNFGHSTISVNNQLHVVDGKTTIIDFKDGDKPEATMDLSPAFGNLLKSAQRRFVKDSPTSLLIEDKIELSEKTQVIIWQMMTTANIQIINGGAILKQDGKELKLEILAPRKINISVVSLDPAPLKFDRQIEGLKRIELRIPAWTFNSKEGKIRVRLTDN